MATQRNPANILKGPRSGEGEALDSLYRRHRDNIRHYVARTFGSGPPEPEDVVHAAFEKYAALDDRSLIENPHAFLVRSARNFVLDQRRRQAVQFNYRQSAEAIGDASDDIDAERVLSAKERWEILETTIRAMDPRKQDVLIMHRIHGLSCAEIARQKGYSATLVKTILAQALNDCEQALRKADGL